MYMFIIRPEEEIEIVMLQDLPEVSSVDYVGAPHELRSALDGRIFCLTIPRYVLRLAMHADANTLESVFFGGGLRVYFAKINNFEELCRRFTPGQLFERYCE